METLQLIMEAGPNAVEAFKYYALINFGESLVFSSTLFGILLTITKVIKNSHDEDKHWNNLTKEEQKELSTKYFEKKNKGK